MRRVFGGSSLSLIKYLVSGETRSICVRSLSRTHGFQEVFHSTATPTKATATETRRPATSIITTKVNILKVTAELLCLPKSSLHKGIEEHLKTYRTHMTSRAIGNLLHGVAKQGLLLEPSISNLLIDILATRSFEPVRADSLTKLFQGLRCINDPVAIERLLGELAIRLENLNQPIGSQFIGQCMFALQKIDIRDQPHAISRVLDLLAIVVQKHDNKVMK